MKRAVRFIVLYLYSLLSSVYLFVLGFLSARHRPLLYAISRHFGFDAASPVTPLIPKISLCDAISEKTPVFVRAMTVRSGNVSLLEVCVINSLIAAHRPSGIFEIGTFDGRTTLNMAANSPADAIIYTLDLPKEKIGETRLPIEAGDREFIKKEASGSRFAASEEAKKIVQLFGDSATFDFAPYRKAMDFVFVDGSHAYEYVLNDSRIALQLLKDGRGWILWHDYTGWEGVTRALNKLYAEDVDFRGMRHIEGTMLVYLAKP